MKKVLISSFLLLLLFGFKYTQQEEVDLTNCVAKLRSEWGTKCMNCGEMKGYNISYEDTYKVWLGNSCDQKIDVKCCVQETDKSWKCYQFNNMSKKDSLMAYACKGTGKYLKWAKKAGDTELIFPTDKEVQEQYKE